MSDFISKGKYAQKFNFPNNNYIYLNISDDSSNTSSQDQTSVSIPAFNSIEDTLPEFLQKKFLSDIKTALLEHMNNSSNFISFLKSRCHSPANNTHTAEKFPDEQLELNIQRIIAPGRSEFELIMSLNISFR